MFKKILLGLLVIIAGILAYASTKPSFFTYERSGVINASPERIFPYLSNFKLGKEWSPYEQKDPNMKRNFIGNDGEAGAVMEFDGNSESGSGKLEMMHLVPNESADIKLTMTKPFHTENLILYKLTPEGTGTRFSWTMSGDGGFIGKLISVFIDCEKMVTKDFEKGIQNLKTVVESQK